MDGLLWVWAYVLAKVVQSDSTVRRLPVSWAFASPPLVFYCLFLYLSGFVRCSKYPDLEHGESASQTGRDHIPPRIFKEMTHLNKQRQKLKELLTGIGPEQASSAMPGQI